MSDNNLFLIYQLKDGDEMRDYRFQSPERLKAAGLAIERSNYNHMYTGILATVKKSEMVNLEMIYMDFHLRRPADFTGDSLSTSDIVVLQRDGKTTAHYIDAVDYVEVPEFLIAPYKYYSVRRPVDIGTFPKAENIPTQIVNFDRRRWVENATFQTWGYLTYDTPLTRKQVEDYELRTASDNPDR